MSEVALVSSPRFPEDMRPQARTDMVVRYFDNEAVAWSAVRRGPVYLDPVMAVVYQLLDGTATIRELSTEVHEVIGVPLAVARHQIDRSVAELHQAGLLESSPNQEADGARPDLFPAPPNP